MIEVEKEFLLSLQKCLSQATLFFQRRDQMNARLHLSDVRYSPLAELVEDNYRKVNVVVNRNSLHDSNSDSS